MAKVVITIEDNPDSEEVNIVMESDPLFNQNDGTPNTEAQNTALALIAALAEAAKDEDRLSRAVAIQDDGTEVKL